MAGYLFTVKDRKTEEILRQGSAKDCAEFIGCDPNYIRILIRTNPEYKAETKYSKYKVERQVCGEVKRGGAHKKDVVCCDCGVLMKNVSATARRCPECARKHNLEHKRQKMRELRNSAEHPNIVNENKEDCEGCVYFFGDYSKCCNYIFIEGKRRQCDPGKGCKVRKERDKNK